MSLSKRMPTFVVCAAVTLGTVTLSRAAIAQGFDVRPVTIETRDGIGLVVVTNPGDRRIYLESQVLDWSQDQSGSEHTAESSVALASPPAMWVPPHSSYTLRVRLPGGGSTTAEQAYRVVIRALPERNDIAGGHIVFALTQNLPAFVIPSDPAAPALAARIDGPRHLILTNTGGRRIRVTGISQDGRSLGSGLLGYALAQGAIGLSLPQPLHRGAIELETDLGRQMVIAR